MKAVVVESITLPVRQIVKNIGVGPNTNHRMSYHFQRNPVRQRVEGPDDGPTVISTIPMNPEDLHFESMETEEDEGIEMMEEELNDLPEDEESQG